MKNSINVCITSGGTSEAIDNVRKITNTSTGKLGSTIADAFIEAGFNVYFVYSKGSITPQHQCKKYEIESASSVEQHLDSLFKYVKIDVMIHAMAISDYQVNSITSLDFMAENIMKLYSDTTPNIHDIKDALSMPQQTILGKISSNQSNLVITMKQTPKIIQALKSKQESLYLIGFKLLSETPLESLIDAAYKQIETADSDLVIANRLEDINATQHVAHFVTKNGVIQTAHTKNDIAQQLVKHIMSVKELS